MFAAALAVAVLATSDAPLHVELAPDAPAQTAPVAPPGTTTVDSGVALGQELVPRKPTVLKVAHGASVLFTGLTAGLYLASTMTHAEARANITAASYLERQTSPVNLFGTAAPLLMASGAVSSALVMWQLGDFKDKRFWMAAFALLGNVAMLTTSLIINVPINQATGEWTAETMPADWLKTYDRWIAGNNIRTTIAIPVFSSALLAALLDE